MTLFENFYNTIRIKNTIYQKLNKTNFPLRTAVIDGNTLTDVGGEGFVIHDLQSTVKIVDRLKFSKPNLNNNN
jgi:spermidine/putrescine-binding protein